MLITFPFAFPFSIIQGTWPTSAPSGGLRRFWRPTSPAIAGLMGADEEGTLAQLKACRRELVDPKIVGHRGRIVKTTGDGMLVEFRSIVEAVVCAVEVQRGMFDRNATVPEDRRIVFRIGINVGRRRGLAGCD
jgi:class 3 adenylate cyclase